MNNNNIFYYMLKARKESFNSTHHRVNIGCVLVKNGRIISRGYNKMRGNNLWKYSKWTNSRHAEVDCLSKVTQKQANKSTLYIYREDRNGNLAISKPCCMCYNMIKDYGIKTIIYTIREKPGFIIEKV